MDNYGFRYTKTHEWIMHLEGQRLRVGISTYGIEELGTLQFIDLPALGTDIHLGEPFALIESTKVTSDLYAPVDGHILVLNEELLHDIHRINQDPQGDGWLVEVSVKQMESFFSLMSQESYDAYIRKGLE